MVFGFVRGLKRQTGAELSEEERAFLKIGISRQKIVAVGTSDNPTVTAMKSAREPLRDALLRMEHLKPAEKRERGRAKYYELKDVEEIIKCLTRAYIRCISVEKHIKTPEFTLKWMRNEINEILKQIDESKEKLEKLMNLEKKVG